MHTILHTVILSYFAQPIRGFSRFAFVFKFVTKKKEKTFRPNNNNNNINLDLTEEKNRHLPMLHFFSIPTTRSENNIN